MPHFDDEIFNAASFLIKYSNPISIYFTHQGDCISRENYLKDIEDMEANNSIISLSQAVEAIKTAILQGQYEAAKDVNRVQLAVYFSIGRYLSKNTRRLPYGAGALKAISEQLRKVH